MIVKSLLYTAIFLICLEGQFHKVLGDFRVVDKWSNKVVFQTASDFVRTGCGSFQEKSYLIASDPLDACEVPSSPPSRFFLTDYISKVFGGSQDDRKFQWVLFAEDGGCDLKTKFRNAASAGYSGIIVGTDERHEEIIHPGLLGEDDEEFIDVHLVHSLDIRVLSKEFFQSENVVVEPPSLSRCRDEYHRTWLRSRYVSLIIRTWKGIMDVCWKCIMWTLVAFGKVAKGLKMVLPFSFYNRDTYSSVAIYLASILISITFMMIISIRNNARKLMKYKSVKERKTSFTESPNCKPQPQPSKPYTPPPPPPRQNFTSQQQQRTSTDYTLRHRINLNISINEPLTKAKVNIAYRDMALKYHPDKNVHLDENELAKITEEFRSKKKSRDMLLLYCTE